MYRIKNLLNAPERVFLIIASLFGLLSATLMPVLAAPDENQHFQVSYAIFSANKKASTDLVLSEDMILKAIRDNSYKDYFTAISPATRQDGFALNTGSLVFDGKTKASIFDVMHLPQAAGVALGRILHPSLGVMVLMGRLFTLAFYITALFFIIKKLRYGRWLLVFIATLPIVIQQAASLSYDAINFVAIFGWLAFITNVLTQKLVLSKKQLVIGAVLVLFLLISKSNNITFLVLLLALPKSTITETAFYQKIRTFKYWSLIKYCGLAFIAALVLIGIYVLSVKLLAGHTFDARQLVAALLNTFFWGDLNLIDVTTIGVIGQFSNFYYHLPVWAVILTFIIFVVLLLTEKIPKVTRKWAVISGGLFFGSILLISVGMYYGWAMRPERLGPGATITDGIQGRYFTPLLLLLLPPFVYLQRYFKITTKSPLFIPALVTISAIMLLAFYIIQTVHFFN